MSKRDGKMYLVPYLVRESESTIGLPIKIADDECAGCMFAFWTKTAARKLYGRNVHLITFTVPDRHDTDSGRPGPDETQP